MGAGSSLLAGIVSLDDVAAALKQEYGVDRVSIARFSSDHSTFEIVGCAGKALLSPGLDVPVELSTQMRPPALGDVFVEASFPDSPSWNRPVDELMVAIGFRSGCSLPLEFEGGSLGAVSLSETHSDRSFERCVDAVRPLLSEITTRLTAADHSQVLVCHDDRVIAEGLARLIERDGLTTATCVDPSQALEGELGYGDWGCVVAGPFLAGRPVFELTDALERAGHLAPLVIVTEEDSLTVQRTAVTGCAATVALSGITEARLRRALASARTGHGGPPRHEAGAAVVRLSPRERDVLLDLDEGLRFKEIARRRGIREPTAKGYARTLFEKLDAHSRTEAVNRAREIGLLSSLRRAQAGGRS